MPHEAIYEFVMERAALLEKHEEELIQRRGFSKDTIKRFRFGSGGPHLLEAEVELIERMRSNEMQEQDLVNSGVFIHDGRAARMNPMLLRVANTADGKEISNILIPYLSDQGSVYHLRPHKLGLAGLSVEVYQDFNLAGNPGEIILTEGEFKAAAGMQYGVPSIAVPGISSFSEQHFPRFVKMLNDRKVGRIVIVFDNETKDDPNIPDRYKPNPHDRYDTQFYAYYMAARLEREAKEVVIATLPEGWKTDGKIDLDGAAAQMRGRGEIMKVLYDARPRNDYLSDLPSEAKQEVLRKNTQKWHRARVKREFNRYVAVRMRGKQVWDEVISNFVMRIVATHEAHEGSERKVRREVEMVNEFGRKSATFSMSAAEMASADTFRAFALAKGDFIWRGSLDDLLNIWESEFLMMDESRFIVENDHIGWIEHEKMWLFGNVAITADGKEIRPDKANIFWLEKRGVKAIPLSMTTGKQAISEGIPYLQTTPFDIQEVKRRLAENIGGNEASVILGWVTAVAFMEELFEAYNSFPFLFVTGRWQSGKSTVAEWIMNFFGTENAAKAISQTTPVAIQRSLGYYSCLPVCLDEYRNTKDIVSKNGFLRNVYNRQSSGKGMREEFGLREAKVRGTLVLSGEETPKDGALLTRCIVVFVSKQKRAVNHYPWFQANKGKFSYHFYDILKRKKDLLPKFVEAHREWREHFAKQEVDDRTAINYASVVAGFASAFGDKDVDFAGWLTKETKLIQAESSEEQAVSVFLDDLGVLKTRRLIDDNYWAVSGDKVYLYFHGLVQVWAQEFKKTRGDEAFKEGTIRAYLKEEPGFLAVNMPWRIKGQLKKCIVFDLEKAPQEIRNLVEVFEEALP